MELIKEDKIREKVRNAIKDFSENFEVRYMREITDPTGVINSKKNNCFIEYDLDNGEKLCSLYYCHPNSPEEKSELEKNHEYIRYVLPKGTSFEDLTVEDIKRLEDNINNIPRDILGGDTPYNLTKEKFPTLIEKLESNYIAPDDVSLNKKDIIFH